MDGFTMIDAGAAIVILLSAILAYSRGLVREAMAIAGWIGAAVLAYIFAGPFAPVLFLLLNGYLLGREFFMLAAERRMSRVQAVALRRENATTVWFAGILMATPLAIPLVNLVIPVLGADTFTHLVHRLARQGDV